MESCFETIKTELEMADCENEGQAHRDLVDYNGDRRHSSLGNLTSIQFGRQYRYLK
jgi:transposase InsO family protein